MNISWLASRPTFLFSGASWATRTFEPENSTPDTSIACSRKPIQPPLLSRQTRGKNWRRSRRSLPECLPCSIQRRPPARMAMLQMNQRSRLREPPTGNRRDARKRCADMVYEIIVGGQSHRFELERSSGRWECRLDGKTVNVDAVIPPPPLFFFVRGFLPRPTTHATTQH